ncbi:MAG TPA: LysE family transporter [Nitrosopumilus sp.]|jgi:threonine/homoserine/homoserine lactone efflux protein|nr:LysE family transporter [Nitrosopumilus sp.]HJM25740.1 LysE family transporter [Nitrosopumilus sp.]HJO31239.1 LysE family transporter [Nitrosopumilus sp.]|tara:strand:- start:340 stop:963 length:624 start_codon:yes stop_codon:yes gene_type:complete
MQFLEFSVLVIIVSASGVMAPGPLFAANLVYGLKQGTKSGIKMAVGHTIVEFPLVILLGIGVFSLESFPEFRTIISIFGAITLFVFAAIQIKSLFRKNESIHFNSKQGPLITGILLSALNPFFIIWWLTIGFKLISDAMMIWAFAGILIVFVLHIWMDFAWLGVVSFLASKSKKIISNNIYKILMGGLSIMLIYFGITFLIETFYQL